MSLAWLVSVVSIALHGSTVHADLRMASTPKTQFATGSRGVRWDVDYAVYFEPSTFNYRGLENQKRRNYDNFLRSNIDNQQDNRNFRTEDGEDHLPFRTLGAIATDPMLTEPMQVRVPRHRRRRRGAQQTITPIEQVNFTVGTEHLMPLRWNNPHASELEVNIWVTNFKIVVPVRKPACSGEGYKDNAFSLIIPTDFNQLATKVPNFRGCTKMGDCVLQIYAHSVESRTYVIGIPLIVPGSDATVPNPATDNSQIQPATVDPGTNMASLKRDVCLPSNETSVHIANAVPRFARLSSDVFNHAYQNSDYSPYQGQQHEDISRNIQAATIVSMVPANRGELGRSLLSGRDSRRLRRARRTAQRLVRRYESITNSIIRMFGNDRMRTTGVVAPHPPRPATPGGRRRSVGQQLGNCFRCAEVGSLKTRRIRTNTYIPSFQLPADIVTAARAVAPAQYQNLVSSAGVVQIYGATLESMSETFAQLERRGFGYMGPRLKNTTTTMADATKFKKITATGGRDDGQYAAQQAKEVQAAEIAARSQAEQAAIANEAQVNHFVTPLSAPRSLLMVLADNSSENVTLPETGVEAVGLVSQAQMDGTADDLPCENDDDNSTSCNISFGAFEVEGQEDDNPVDPDLIDGSERTHFARLASAALLIATVGYF